MATNRLKPRPLYLDLMELALVEADEPQTHFHFPLFRSATTRVSSRKHKQRPVEAVVVKSYDMRGRLAHVQDLMSDALAAYQRGDKRALHMALAHAGATLQGALVQVEAEMPIDPEKRA